MIIIEATVKHPNSRGAGSYVWRSGIKVVNCGICDELFNDFKKAMKGE